jgi:hypothetical protein
MKKQCVTELEKIKNISRYVWHIKPCDPSSALSIAEQGLIGKKENLVFAHNNLRLLEDSYPYFIDCYDFMMYRDIKPKEFFSVYEYWRIDTSLLDFDWFIDPYMVEDISVYCSRFASVENFICTPNNIPPHALKLFNFVYSRYLDRPTRVQYFEGAVCASPCRNDFDTLVYNHQINGFINHLANKNI